MAFFVAWQSKDHEKDHSKMLTKVNKAIQLSNLRIENNKTLHLKKKNLTFSQVLIVSFPFFALILCVQVIQVDALTVIKYLTEICRSDCIRWYDFVI